MPLNLNSFHRSLVIGTGDSNPAFHLLLAFALAFGLALPGLLSSERGLETLLILVDVSLVALGVDERIRIAGAALL